MQFSSQEYWGGLSYPPPGNLPDQGFEPRPLVAPALQVDSLPLSYQGKRSYVYFTTIIKKEKPKDLTESRQSFGSGDLKVISGMLFFLFYDPSKAQPITQVTKHFSKSLNLSLCAACSTRVNEVETLHSEN